MVVYVVMILVDEEYGGRDMIKGFSTKKQAKDFIREHGQTTVECWYGDEPLYTIEELEID